MLNYQSIRFSKQEPLFYQTLNQRVNEYFKTNHLSRNANPEMVLKTVFMYALYLVPYSLIMTQVITGTIPLLLACVVMGVGIAGIGLAVMHDANHGAYSSKAWINDMLGFSLNVVGGNAINWKIQHNVLHHTYTNIHEVDEDISPRGVLRMTPHTPWLFIHRFQHIYAWFLYGLMTFVWVLAKDFVRIIKYQKDGLLAKQRTTATKQWIILLISKVIYVGYLLVLPAVLTPLAWYEVFLGFFVMHYVGGFILAIIFQPAHVSEGTEFPLPDAEGNMENNWAIHQLHTTTNFANNNRILSWYVGGLNYQIEHHLFPNVCHVHYRSISKIVKQTAKEFNLPYMAQPTFRSAIAKHAKLLYEFGKKPVMAISPA
jgi:linoleoyl-CoA desaturase